MAESEWSDRLSACSVLFTLLWLAGLANFRTRSPRVIGDGLDEYQRVVSASFWSFGVIAIASLLLKLDIARHLWQRQLSRERSRGRCRTSVVAIGDKRAASTLARELTRNPNHGYGIVGAGIPGYSEPRGEAIVVGDQSIPILGNEVRAIEAIGEYGANTVAITDTDHFGPAGIRRLLWQLEADRRRSGGLSGCVRCRRPTADPGVSPTSGVQPSP